MSPSDGVLECQRYQWSGQEGGLASDLLFKASGFQLIIRQKHLVQHKF